MNPQPSPPVPPLPAPDPSAPVVPVSTTGSYHDAGIPVGAFATPAAQAAPASPVVALPASAVAAPPSSTAAEPPAPVASTFAPAAMPSKAPDVAPPVHQQPVPVVLTPDAAPLATATPQTVPAVSGTDAMTFSANTMNVRKLGKLHALNVLLYIVMLCLAGGVAVGGWLLFKYLSAGGHA